eukprot:COSAG01_NODE_2907_length_6880_cov_10.488204_6_plen_51_part_00
MTAVAAAAKADQATRSAIDGKKGGLQMMSKKRKVSAAGVPAGSGVGAQLT